MRESTKNLIREIPIVLLGNLFVAIASSFLVLPNDLLVGGSAGLSVAITAFFKVDQTVMINLLMFFMFLLGAITLGKKFAIQTIVSTIAMPSFVWICNVIYQSFPVGTFQMDPLLACIYSGIIIGFGVGLVYRTSASTGGMDIPPLVLRKYTGISLPILVLIVDGITVLLGVIGYGLEPALEGLLSVWVSVVVIDRTLTLGSVKSKQVQIITSEYVVLTERIHQELQRGTTLLSGKGGFTNEERMMVVSIVASKEYPKLLLLIKEIDPSAFVIVSDVNEVHGEGFSPKKEEL